MDGLLYIMMLMNRKNKWFLHIHEFNKEKFILPSNITISNISEEGRYTTFMTPTGFITGQYESIFLC